MTPIRPGRKWQVDPRKLSLRPYEGTQADLAALTRVRNDTLRATTLPEDFQELTPEEMAAFYESDQFTLVGNAWLMFHDEEPVAAAVVYPMAAFHTPYALGITHYADRPPGNFHLYVVPAFGRHGIGSRLLDHLEQAALERGHPVLETTIAAEDGKSTKFLLDHGFSVVGHSVHLARSLDGELPPTVMPAGFAIRSLADLRESAELYRGTTNRLGAYDPGYSLLRPEEVDRLIVDGRWDPTGVLFAIAPGGRIVGVIRASKSDGRGYLDDVRLEPASRGKGLGMSLVASALNHLAGSGVRRVELDTASENTAAHNLALKAGFEEVRHWLRFLKRLEVPSSKFQVPS